MKIEDYGFLSDLETAALVGRDGSIDWFCTPRFDSPACFAKLVGVEENGFWRISPRDGSQAVRRRYIDGTLILEADFETTQGKVRLTDFLAVRHGGPALHRTVAGLAGSVEMEMILAARFDYGCLRPWVQECGQALVLTGGPDAMILHGTRRPKIENDRLLDRFSLREGERLDWSLKWFPSHERLPEDHDCARAMEVTADFWTKWSEGLTYEGPWAAAVDVSARVLKGLIYHPTGGVLAAATTGLPEKIGGIRNWDYRYCWLRDAALTFDALLDAGFRREAAEWRDWLLRVIGGSPASTQIVYGLSGERRLPEYELGHLAGYEGSIPVRVGNGAAHQFQLDIYGQVLDAMFQARRAGVAPKDDSWRIQRGLVEFVIGNWREADEGLWEVRGPRQHFTHSKIMAWVALDRALRTPGIVQSDRQHWARVRKEIHDFVCERAFHREAGAFTLHPDTELLDASVLIMPVVGFLPASDERVQRTVRAIERGLMREGFVYRYDPDRMEEIDGLPSGEGAFLPCSFWMADAWELMGRHGEACELFERLLGVRNDLGLLTEEYDPLARRLVGNFPQAFSHVGLINSACLLSGRGKATTAGFGCEPTAS